jgi:hypothetical protein
MNQEIISKNNIVNTIENIKQSLDKQLESRSKSFYPGIALGEKLFSEFKERGWFTLESFGILGTSVFATQVPAYKKNHFVFISWDIDALAFEIGKEKKEG